MVTALLQFIKTPLLFTMVIEQPLTASQWALHNLRCPNLIISPRYSSLRWGQWYASLMGQYGYPLIPKRYTYARKHQFQYQQLCIVEVYLAVLPYGLGLHGSYTIVDLGILFNPKITFNIYLNNMSESLRLIIVKIFEHQIINCSF